MRRLLLNLLTAVSVLLFIAAAILRGSSYSDPPLFRFLDCELLAYDGELMLWSNARHDWIVMHFSISTLLILTLAVPLLRAAAMIRRRPAGPKKSN